jgi:hypothetical protein
MGGRGPVEDRKHEGRAEGLVPGIIATGIDWTKAGLRGKAASAFAKKWAIPLDGIRLECVPPGLREILQCPDALEVASRTIEQTFRNFQIHSRRPSHIDPPFSATRIHGFATTVVNSLFPAYTTLFDFTTPAETRGVIAEIGQQLDSEGLFSVVSWRILLSGVPFPPYNDIRNHLWNMVGPTRLCDPIRLRGDERFTLQATRTDFLIPTNVTWQVCGWTYPVRAETGNNIKSTLTD